MPVRVLAYAARSEASNSSPTWRTTVTSAQRNAEISRSHWSTTPGGATTRHLLAGCRPAPRSAAIAATAILVFPAPMSPDRTTLPIVGPSSASEAASATVLSWSSRSVRPSDRLSGSRANAATAAWTPSALACRSRRSWEDPGGGGRPRAACTLRTKSRANWCCTRVGLAGAAAVGLSPSRSDLRGRMRSAKCRTCSSRVFPAWSCSSASSVHSGRSGASSSALSESVSELSRREVGSGSVAGGGLGRFRMTGSSSLSLEVSLDRFPRFAWGSGDASGL